MRSDSSVFPFQKLLFRHSIAEGKPTKNNSLPSVREFLEKRYYWFVPFLGIIIVFLQAIEHFTSLNRVPAMYMGEVVMMVILLFTTGFLTRSLMASLSERSRMVDLLRMKHQLRTVLTSGVDIHQIVDLLNHYSSKYLQASRVELRLFDKNRNKFVLTPGQSANLLPEGELDTHSGFDPLHCQVCIQHASPTVIPYNSCRQADNLRQKRETNHYCLPLIHGSRPIGLLHFCFMDGRELPPQKIDLVKNVADEIASSLAVAIEKKAREEMVLSQKIRTIQLDIARDLHDTIGQNISYLRMRLDRMSEQQECITGTSNEFSRMREVADESYEMIRGTLAVLQTESSNDLMKLFTRYAGQVAERSEFILDFNECGQPQQLTANQMRQMFYVFREALSNIEKYSKASQVCVELNWQTESVVLSISDNGVGFDSAASNQNGHYGLKFMRERIENLNGSLVINSKPGYGTSITVRIPH
jgi:signal transduction histidine kinase